MSDVIAQFLDVDFTRYPQYVRGWEHVGGKQFFGRYEDTADIIKPADWPELAGLIDKDGGGADVLVTRIYDQGQEGACVANACSQAHEILQAKTLGKDRVTHLSAMSLYQRIGSSASSGAMVSDGLEELEERGVLPLDTPENRVKFGDKVMPNTGWRSKRPSGWEATAMQFRVDEFTIIDSLEEMMTALLNQHPVVVGRQGHSICYVRPMYRNGVLVAKYANSWGDWGDNGFGYDSLKQMNLSSGWAFAARSIVLPQS